MADPRNFNQDPTQNEDLNKARDGNDVRYKVMKPFNWEERALVVGTDASPSYVWMTAEEAKAHLANGNVVAA